MAADDALARLRADYAATLATLTINSRPLINTLTMIAEDNRHAAALLVELVVAQLEQAPPKQKLPVLYLVDSLVKNAREPFTSLFARRIVPLYTSTYAVVDDAVRRSMEKLLGTWPGVFEEPILRALHDYVRSRGGAAPSLPPPPAASRPAYPPPQERPPYPAPGPGPVPPPAAAAPSAWPPREPHAQPGRPYYAAAAAPTLYGYPPAPSPAPYADPRGYGPPPPAPAPYGAPSSAPYGGASYGGGYYGAGYGPSAPYPAPPAAAASPVPPAPATPVGPAPVWASASLGAAAAPISTIQLTNDALKRRYVGAVEALWDNLRKVCGTCGMRYRDDAEGQKDFSAHMDWHFRRNALEKKKVLKAVSREWYLPANLWTSVADAAAFVSAREDQLAKLDEDAASEAAAAAANNAVCPVDDDTAGVCAVCGDKFAKFFDSEREAWMYRGAVRHHGSIYHPACLDDAEKSGAGGKRRASSSPLMPADDGIDSKRFRVQ